MVFYENTGLQNLYDIVQYCQVYFFILWIKSCTFSYEESPKVYFMKQVMNKCWEESSNIQAFYSHKHWRNPFYLCVCFSWFCWCGAGMNLSFTIWHLFQKPRLVLLDSQIPICLGFLTQQHKFTFKGERNRFPLLFFLSFLLKERILFSYWTNRHHSLMIRLRGMLLEFLKKPNLNDILKVH